MFNPTYRDTCGGYLIAIFQPSNHVASPNDNLRAFGFEKPFTAL